MSSINTWYRKVKKESEKRKFEKRKQQVSTIKNRVYNVSEGYVSSINGKMDKLNAYLTTGIKGLGVVEALKTSISGKKEKTGTNDSYLSDYNDELASELTDCKNKIDSLEIEIADLYRQYNNEVESEREAARQAARQALANLKI